MNVKCRYCNAVLELNQDNEETRNAGTDPAQQIRRHLLTHPLSIVTHARRMGWLIDALAFESTDPAGWRKHISDLVDFSLSEEALK